jgi:hypothetical protein
VVVTARDGWEVLDRWRARRQFVWTYATRSVSQILLALLARAGLEISNTDPSAALTTLEPAFTVHAGESGITAVRRLLAMVEDLGRWDGSGFETIATADDDVAGYSLGTDEHAVLAGVYRVLAPEVNRVRVIGFEAAADVVDFDDAEASGERIAQVIDVNLVTGDECADRAAAVLRKSRLAAQLAEVRLFGVHCGVELFDVVELVDPEGGADGDYRVQAFSWRYEPQRGRYDMQLTLGPV